MTNMWKSEMKNLINKTYDEVVQYLLEKYGPIKEDYFLDETYKEPNRSIKKGNEGLFIHHIDEDKGIMLSNPEIIKYFDFPFEWQKAERLVYCDLLEHLLLHVKIQEYPNINKHPNCDVGIGGTLNFIIPELNDIYSGIKYKSFWKKRVIENVINRKEDYFLILNKLKELGVTFEEFSSVKSLPQNKFIWDSENNEKLLKEIEKFFL